MVLGQGYLWMTHKTPGSDIWELAMRSHELWRSFAESLHEQGLDPQVHLGWKNTGTICVCVCVFIIFFFFHVLSNKYINQFKIRTLGFNVV